MICRKLDAICSGIDRVTFARPSRGHVLGPRGQLPAATTKRDGANDNASSQPRNNGVVTASIEAGGVRAR